MRHVFTVEDSGGVKKWCALLRNCSAPSIGLNMDQHPELMDYLPKDYEYHVCSYEHVSQPCSWDHISFNATLRMTLKTKEDVQVWLKSMPDTWRVESVRPTKGKKTILKKFYRCQHNTRTPETPGRKSKNTNCSAKLVVTVLPAVNTNGRRSRSTDPHIPAYPTVVEMSHLHNHNIHDPGALRYRDVGPATVEKLLELFKAGHSPRSAIDVLKYDLQVEFGDDYLYKAADRSICPDVHFCYRLYKETFMAEYGSTEQQATSEQAPLDSSNGCSDHSPVQSPEMAIAVSEGSDDDAQTSAKQQVSRSTEVVVGDEESDVDDEEFRSKMINFTETLLMNKRLLKGGLKVMMKTIDKMVGHRSMLLAPSMLLSAMHTFGHSGANSLASQRAQGLRQWQVTKRTAARVTSIARPEFRLGKLYRIPKGPGRRKKTVKHGSSLQPRNRGVKHSACPNLQ